MAKFDDETEFERENRLAFESELADLTDFDDDERIFRSALLHDKYQEVAQAHGPTTSQKMRTQRNKKRAFERRGRFLGEKIAAQTKRANRKRARMASVYSEQSYPEYLEELLDKNIIGHIEYDEMLTKYYEQNNEI